MWRKNPQEIIVKTTEELLRSYLVKTTTGRRARFSIPLVGALQLPERALPLDPYILGLWFGDGRTHGGDLTLGAKDTEAIRAEIEKRGFTTEVYRDSDNCNRVKVLREGGNRAQRPAANGTVGCQGHTTGILTGVRRPT